MKIVVLDGYTLNPGDISWSDLEALGEVTVYDRTKADEIVEQHLIRGQVVTQYTLGAANK